MAVTFEPHPVRILRPDSGLKLITPTPEKLRLLEASGLDAVLLLPFGRDLSLMTPRQFAEKILKKQLRAREVHEGYNFHFGHKAAGNVDTLAEFGREMGFEVKVYPEMKLRGEPVSSSHVRQLLSEGRVSRARHLLGHPFSMLSTPGRGRGYGSKYTVPTINLSPLRRVRAQGRRLHRPHPGGRGVLRFGDQRGRPPHLRGGILRGRNSPPELPSPSNWRPKPKWKFIFCSVCATRSNFPRSMRSASRLRVTCKGPQIFPSPKIRMKHDFQLPIPR